MSSGEIKTSGCGWNIKAKMYFSQKILSRWTEFPFAGRKNALWAPEETNLEPVQRRRWVWWLWECRISHASPLHTSAKSLLTYNNIGGENTFHLWFYFTTNKWICKLLGMFKGCMSNFDQKCNILKRAKLPPPPPPCGIILSTVFSCFHCVKIVDFDSLDAIARFCVHRHNWNQRCRKVWNPETSFSFLPRWQNKISVWCQLQHMQLWRCLFVLAGYSNRVPSLHRMDCTASGTLEPELQG